MVELGGNGIQRPPGVGQVLHPSTPPGVITAVLIAGNGTHQPVLGLATSGPRDPDPHLRGVAPRLDLDAFHHLT